ncbi:MAG: type IV secretory system conjugative DNA transfer family protein [Chloroflexota bacterium]|nr:type IV secretory system conjugative DNA transfer family protein [Chloroflexota bacterium]
MSEIVLGHYRKPGSAIKRFLKVDTTDAWSVRIVGAPGMGKSTFQATFTEQCLDADEGVILIDPKGLLAQEVVSGTKHLDKLVYVAPHEAAAAGHYWALNPLEFDRNQRWNFSAYATSLTELLENIGEYDPKQMRDIHKIVSESVRLALSHSGSTFMDTYLIIHDEAYRRRLLANPHLPDLTYDFWVNVFPKTEREQRHQVWSTDSRLREILEPVYLNYMLNQPKTSLKLAEWLNEGRLIVVNLDQTYLGRTDSEKIANLLLGYLSQESIRRPTGQTARVWRIVVDEFHRMATIPFAKMIEDMRTYNVFPVLAHQHGAQMDPRMKHAAEQCSVKVDLRLSSSDAAALARLEGVEVALQRLALEKYTAVVTIESQGPRGSRRVETVKLLPWWSEDRPERPEQLVEARQRQLQLAKKHSELRKTDAFDRFRRDGDGSPSRGTKEGHDRRDRAPNRTNRRPQEASHPSRPDSLQPRPGRALPDGDDPDGMGDAGQSQPFSFLDLASGGSAPLSGSSQPQGGNPLGRRRPKGRQ